MTPTYYKDGHLFFSIAPEKPDSILGDRLVINPQNLGEVSKYVREKSIKSITINPAYHAVNNLDFLDSFLSIEGIYILQDGLDLSPINKLKNLRALSFNESKTKVDLRNFPNLEVLGITFNKNIINLNKCAKLFWLWLDNFKKNNLEELQSLSNLKYLNLYKTAIIDFKGICKLTNLISLKIDSASKLETLEDISSSNTQLKVIDIYGAKNLHNYTSLSNAKSIQKIFLRKTGETEDISFLNPLSELQEVIIGMKVIDGNMSRLKLIPKAGFLEFPHYNLKMNELSNPF